MSTTGKPSDWRSDDSRDGSAQPSRNASRKSSFVNQAERPPWVEALLDSIAWLKWKQPEHQPRSEVVQRCSVEAAELLKARWDGLAIALCIYWGSRRLGLDVSVLEAETATVLAYMTLRQRGAVP